MTFRDLTGTDLSSSGANTRHRQSIGLLAICLGFLMITLDATIVNVALGTIQSDLGGSLGSAQWIVNGYTLAFATLLLTAGALADRVGARAGYLIGLAVFGVGSAACAFATSISMLVSARVLQGFGAAWLMPTSLALIAHAFPDVTARRRALAAWGGASGIGLASGPVLGGVLTTLVGWRAIFLVNVPIALLAATLLVVSVDETRRHRRPLDWPGQLLAALSLATLSAGFISAGAHGWGAAETIGLLVAGAGAAASFALVERSRSHAMVDPELFVRRSFSIAVAIGVIFNFCLYGAIFCLAVDLRSAHGLSSFGAGLALLPMTLVTGGMALLTSRVVARFGEWSIMRVGLGAGAIGAIAVALNTGSGSTIALVASSIPLGLTALAMPAMTAVAMNGVPPHRVGLASGVFNAFRQTGGALGVAILGSLVAIGRGAPSLHVAFAAVALSYGVAMVLATVGGRVGYRQRAVGS